MFARVCYDCLENHRDIVDKKVSKGCIVGFTPTKDKDECYLSHMHDVEGDVTGKDTMKIKFKQPGSWVSEVGVIDMDGYETLTALLNDKRFVTIDIDGTRNSVNTSKLISACEYVEKEGE